MNWTQVYCSVALFYNSVHHRNSQLFSSRAISIPPTDEQFDSSLIWVNINA
jgi:hypothetical protein